MKNISVFVSILLFGFSVFVVPAFALTDEECKEQDPSFALNEVGICVPTETGLSDKDIGDVVLAIMQWFLYIFGALAVIAFTLSGLMYLTAAGDENQIDKAKRQMIYSIVGVIIALGGLVIITAIDSWLKGNSNF